MNPIDLLIVALVALAVVGGVRAGFVATLYGLVTWITSLILGFALLGTVAPILVGLLGLAEPVARAVAFIAVLLAFEVLFSLAGRTLVWPLIGAVHATRIGAAADRILGVIPAVLRTLVVTAIGLAALVLLPIGSDVRAAIEGSRIARALIAEVAAVQPYLSTLVGGPEGTALFVTKIDAEGREDLDLPSDLALEVDPVAERQMLDLVNEARAAEGLPALRLDPRLVPVARTHSEEMFRLRYFSHISPVTGSPFDRLAAAEITYRRAGENLAYAHTVTVAHRGLMESTGHRANILRPEFTHIGIGVVSAGPYGRMFTQLFLTPP